MAAISYADFMVTINYCHQSVALMMFIVAAAHDVSPVFVAESRLADHRLQEL